MPLIVTQERIQRSDKYNGTTSDVNLGTMNGLFVPPFSFLWYGRPRAAGENAAASYLWGKGPSASANSARVFIADTAGAISGVGFGTSSTTPSSPNRTFTPLVTAYGVPFFIAGSHTGSVTQAGLVGYGSPSDGGPLRALAVFAGADGTGVIDQQLTNNFHIGNREGTDRTFNGDDQLLAVWGRVLGLPQLLRAQFEGPLAVPDGLVLCWANGRDYGPFRFPPISTTVIDLGPILPEPGTILGPKQYIWVNAAAGGGTTINGIVGNAVAAGVTATVLAAATIDGIVGNVVAAGATASVSEGGAIAPPTVTAERVYAVKLTAGAPVPLYTKGTPREIRIPASTTKLLIANCARAIWTTDLSLQTTATIAAGDLSESINIATNDIITRLDLLRLLFVESNNTSARVLQRLVGQHWLDIESGGAGNAYTRGLLEINNQAAALGMVDSVFFDAHGLSASNETTVEDLCLAWEALSTDTVIRDICSLSRVRVFVTRSGSPFLIEVNSTSTLIGDVGVVGYKSGSLNAPAIYNYTALWEAPNGQLIIMAIMDCANAAARYSDIRAIIAELPIDFPDLATPAVPWTPDRIYVTPLTYGGGLVDLAEIDDKFTDTGGTTPVALLDDPVRNMQAKYGTLTFTAAGTTAALWKTTKITYDGGDDLSTTGAQVVDDTSLFCDVGDEFTVGVRFESTDTAATLLEKDGVFEMVFDGTKISINLRGTTTDFTEDVNNGSPHVALARWDGATAVHSIDSSGARELAVGAGAVGTNDIVFGTGFAGSSYKIAIVDRALDTDTYRRFGDWLRGGTPNAFADPTGGVGGAAGKPALYYSMMRGN